MRFYDVKMGFYDLWRGLYVIETPFYDMNCVPELGRV